MRILLAVLASIVATPPPAHRGLKIVTVTRQPRLPPVETTAYVAHDRRRREFRNIFGERSSPTAPETCTHGPRMAMVERCDPGQRFELNLDAREYTTGIRLSTTGSWMGSLERKVTELTSMPLDAALFEVPKGFYHTNRWDRVLMSHAATARRRVEWQMRHLVGLGI